MDQSQNASAPLPEPRDLSRTVISLARMIDRLPNGEYFVHVTKTPAPLQWGVTIISAVTIRRAEIGRAATAATEPVV